MQVRILGPIEVMVDGAGQGVPGLRRKAVLAALALQPGQVVSADRLIGFVWDDGTAPAGALNTLQSHVSYLRGLFHGRSAIVTRPPGYVLSLGTEATDVQAAERLIAEGLSGSDPAGRVKKLGEAIALWRGPALADVRELTGFSEAARRLDDLLLQARRGVIEARLALGHHAQVIAELEALAQEHPFFEEIHGLLMLALYRTGRQSDALAVYRDLARRLDGDLGLAPSQALQDLHASVLRQDSDLDLAEESDTVTPAQLPPVPATFVGRTTEVARLDRASQCAVISGSAGTGKTTLALYWAHRAAANFPDGQLYVNLRGFGPSGTALEPADAIRGFLRAFGISGRRLPADPDAQIGLYRSLLAGKRVLVVLDNARDVDQVRPLLPGAAGCAAVVTSRSHLTALVATQDATAVILAQLSTEESRDLLALRLGAQRTAAEPDAVDEIVTRCARLPLALSIVAARAATHPAFPLAALADELRMAGPGLDPFDAGDPSADVRSVFSWSYQALSADSAALFRLLGLHPGPDLTAYAAASLIGLPLSRVRRLLTELARAHLLTEHLPGRYAFHDLLRAYAVELCSRHDSPGGRHTALERILDHYMHTACIARRRFYRALRGPELNEPRDGVRVEEITDERHALAWFAAERPVLSAILGREPDGFENHTWPLAWAVYPYLSENGYWHDNLLFQRAGLDAALRSGAPAAKAHAHRNLGMAYVAMDQISEGDRHLEVAWRLSTEAGDHLTAASVDLSITYVCDRRNDVPRALQHAERAYGTFGLLGDEHGQARAGNFVGWCLGRLGRYEEGLAYCEQALGVLMKLGDGAGSAEALDSLSAIHFGLGDAEQGAACSQQAAAMYRDMGDAMNEANTFVALGDRQLQAGNDDPASEAWQRALTILDGRAPGPSADVRARLAALEASRRRLGD